MRVLIQRVSHASVNVDGQITGSIGPGLLLLTGFGQGDNDSILESMASKIAHLRIFSDDSGRFNYSLIDIDGEALLVPQFTLYADTSKGRRPEFFNALKPDYAKPLTQKFKESLLRVGIKNVASGIFGAHMKVELLNDGPVTIMLDSEVLARTPYCST